MRFRLLGVLLLMGVGVGAFFLGRDSAPRTRGTAPGAFKAGYLAGREAAFGNYDGGWGYGELYVVVLRRGGPRITYRVARRWPMFPGVEYRVCGRTLCSRKASSAASLRGSADPREIASETRTRSAAATR
jgi:hypothetical protein